MQEVETASAGKRALIINLETQLSNVRTDRDEKRESLALARFELAEHRQKVEVLDRGLDEMERRRMQVSELLVQRQQEIEVWSEQMTQLEAESTREQARSAQIAETLVVAQQQVEIVRTELIKLESAITAIENSQSALRQQTETAHNDLSKHEVRFAETRQRAEFLKEEVQREFQIEISGINWKQLLWRADDEPEGIQALDLDEDDSDLAPPEESDRETVFAESEASATSAPTKRKRKKKELRGEPTEDELAQLDSTDWTQVKADVDALRQRLNGMGAVNLVAIEEYAELKQRHDFLKTQCDDLTNARADLLGVIDEINQTSQQQFAITFEQIQKNFKYTFETLFGGGKAALELIVAEDILESGIEIVAQPQGTKLKSISLLSGGQKTLTAVALLFALYMVKPSPFCLLDELDAPLDESNIGRFTNLLKQFVGESQFIIITHNKRTVAAANAIYGVTMEERGVSKTVSMRFNHKDTVPEEKSQNIADAVSATQG